MADSYYDGMNWIRYSWFIDVENSLISFGPSSHLSHHTCSLPVVHVAFFKLINISVLNVKLPYDLVCPLVGRSVGVSLVGFLVGRSVFIFLKGGKFHFHASIRVLILIA